MKTAFDRVRPVEQKGFLRRLRELLFGQPLASLADQMQRTLPAKRNTRDLYLLEADFEVHPGSEAEKAIEQYRSHLLATYGIELLPILNGFKIRRWDDL